MRVRSRISVGTACALALLGGGAVRAAAATDTRPVRPPGLATELGTERLSDEERVTRVANAVLRAPVHRLATTSSPRVGRLSLRTEDGPLEVYLVLESQVDESGRLWMRVRLPKRPNGRTGWVLGDALSTPRVVRTKLLIDRGRLRATLYRDGRRIWTSPIGVGKQGTPTPAGRFLIRERLRGLRGGGSYGPWAFGTSAYSVLSDWPGGGVVGIHGTNEPQLIPGRPSHGCIRVPNKRISLLARRMPVGTPVQII